MVDTSVLCFLMRDMKFFALINSFLFYSDSSSFGYSRGFEVRSSNFLYSFRY